jgi:hypothetical protein
MMEGLGADSEAKPEPASDIDTSIERQRSGNEKPQFLAKNGEASKRPGAIIVRTKWSLTIRHADRGDRSIISENKFNTFADMHATTMKIKTRKNAF